MVRPKGEGMGPPKGVPKRGVRGASPGKFFENPGHFSVIVGGKKNSNFHYIISTFIPFMKRSQLKLKEFYSLYKSKIAWLEKRGIGIA